MSTQTVYSRNLYLGRVLRVVDGDTLWCDVDLGLRVRTDTEIRLLGIDAPERTEPDAYRLAKEWLTARLPVGTRVLLQTRKPSRSEGDSRDKYGRWLGTVWPWPYDGDAPSINHEVVAAGHAVWSATALRRPL